MLSRTILLRLLIVFSLVMTFAFGAYAPVQALGEDVIGYFYLISGVTGGSCVDVGGGNIQAQNFTIQRLAYVPSDNAVATTYPNTTFGSGGFILPAQGAPGAGQPGTMNMVSSNPGPAPVTFSATAVLSVGGSVVGSSTATVRCDAAGATPVVTLSDNFQRPIVPPPSDAPPVFQGPGLPDMDARNLVLFGADTPVLAAPGGILTGEVVFACQTAFVLEESDGYGRIFVMGGWVSLANTRDVPEDYGQPGSPVAPDCEGK